MANFLAPFWHWGNAIPTELIRLASAEMDAMPLERGRLHGDREALSEVRKSDVLMLNPTHWLCGILYNYATLANLSAGWGRMVDRPQTVQFARYGVEDHYNWHADTNPLATSPVSRKITSICLLSSKSDFEGGSLEIEGVDKPIDLDIGSVVAFPSILRHRVTPVTRGERRSATCCGL
jgi:PKHD-type hydroxylase